jgi:serine/threonine protein kinase
MAETFNPYHKWLGIPLQEQPPNHYRLLGIPQFESDHDVIDTAANRQLAHIRTYQSGKYAEISQRILNEISRARVTLLNDHARDEYNAKLGKRAKAQAAAAGPSAKNSDPWPEGKVPSSVIELRQCLVATEIVSERDFESVVEKLPPQSKPADPKEMAEQLIKLGKLTKFQAAAVLKGRQRNLLLGEYLVLDKIGQGGMGQVLRAQHRRMKRIAALKIMSAAALTQTGSLKRFMREAQAAGKLIHPNIVTAFDAGDHDGIHFLAMEFVDGKDLATIVKERGALPIDKAVDYTIQVARGLQYAHEQGVVHRDIKPGNLLLDKSGAVKILDMGLARVDDPLGDASNANLTQSGTIVGTVDYMSPEQAFDTASVDARTDIYSLGCTLFYFLTAQSPVRGDTIMKKLLAHREGKQLSLRAIRPDVPQELEAVFQGMVAKDPDERFASCSEVIAALQQAKEQPPLPPLPPPPPSAVKPPDYGLSVAPVPEEAPDSGLMRFVHSMAAESAPKNPGASQLGKTARPRPKKAALSSWLMLGGVGVAVIALLVVGIAMAARNRKIEDKPEHTKEVTEKPKEKNAGEKPIETPAKPKDIAKEKPPGKTPPEKPVDPGRKGTNTEFPLGTAARDLPAGIKFAGGDFSRDVQALAADYWKAIDARDDDARDAVLQKTLALVDRNLVSSDSLIRPAARQMRDKVLRAEWGVGTKLPRIDSAVGWEKSTIEIPGGSGGHRLAFSPDDTLLVASAYEPAAKANRVLVFRWPDASFQLVLPGNSQTITELAFSSDGSRLAGGAVEGEVIVWDMQQNKILKKFDRQQTVTGLGFLEGNQVVVAAAAGNAAGPHGVQAWNIDSFSPVKLSWGDDSLWSHALAISSKGNRAALSSFGHVRYWNTADGERRDALIQGKGDEDIKTLAISQDGKLLASGAKNGRVRLWRLPELKEQSLTAHSHGGGAAHVALSPDGRLLASSGEDKTLRIWDTRTGYDLENFGRAGRCYGLAFSSDGQTVATCGEDKVIRLWDMSNLYSQK